jgi:hypothetical protein
MKNKVRVKPEYKQTLDGVPIPNPEDDAWREQLHDVLKRMHRSSSNLLDDIDQFKNILRRQDFLQNTDFFEARDQCTNYSDNVYDVHKWIHANHVAVGWTEWESNTIERCDTTSSTSTKEAS